MLNRDKTSKGCEIDNFTVFNLEKKPDNYVYTGVHGLQVYINDRIAKQCFQINHNLFKCQSVLWVNILNTFILGTLYVPCQSSPHYNPDFFEDLALDMAHIQENYDLPFMIIGDFNSRTGTLNEIMMSESDDIIFDSSNSKFPDVIDILKSLNLPFERSNKDRIKIIMVGV